MEGGRRVERSSSVDIDIGHAVFMRSAWGHLQLSEGKTQSRVFDPKCA